MICDTSGLIASMWNDQSESETCRSVLTGAVLRVVSPLVLSELDRLIRRRVGGGQALTAQKFVTSRAFELATLDRADLSLAGEVMANHRDLDVDLVDASLVVLARRYETNEILTLDTSTFRAIRGLDGRHFRLLPFDLT